MPRTLMNLTPYEVTPKKRRGRVNGKAGSCYTPPQIYDTRVRASWYLGTPEQRKELLSSKSSDSLYSIVNETSYRNLYKKAPHCSSFVHGNPINCDMPYFCLDCAERISYKKAKDWTSRIVAAATILKDNPEYEEDSNGFRIIEPEYRKIYWVGYKKFTPGNEYRNSALLLETYKTQLRLSVEHAQKAGYHAAIFHVGISSSRPNYVHIHGFVITDGDLVEPEGFECSVVEISTHGDKWTLNLENVVHYMLKYPVTDYFYGKKSNSTIDEVYIRIAEAFKSATPLRTMGALANHYRDDDELEEHEAPEMSESVADTSYELPMKSDGDISLIARSDIDQGRQSALWH